MKLKFWEKGSVESIGENVKVPLGVKMGEITINPTRIQIRNRNDARIETIKKVLNKLPLDSPRRAGFEKELERRILEARLDDLKGGK